MSLFRSFRIGVYILFEMLPSFILGLCIFIAIILMFQVLRLTEFTLAHGVSLAVISEVIFFICISLLPALFPMALLFSVLLTYGRLSQDSEVIAMKAVGLSTPAIITPAIILGLFIGSISAQTSFYIAPWGNRQFEVLFTQLGHTKSAIAVKEGTFSTGFFDLVVYANKVDSKTGDLFDVFIYDEKPGEVPLTIVAKRGHLIPDTSAPGHNVLLRLEDGDIHRRTENHTKIKFEAYDVRLIEPLRIEEKEKTPPSLTIEDLRQLLNKSDLKKEDFWIYHTEYHKRMSIATLCLIFCLVGLGLGINPNKRQQKSNTMFICVMVIISYWVISVALENLARQGQIPATLGMWTPNILFIGFAFYRLKLIW
jgi:lipopolysaccharide export system permease protein